MKLLNTTFPRRLNFPPRKGNLPPGESWGETCRIRQWNHKTKDSPCGGKLNSNQRFPLAPIPERGDGGMVAV